MLAITAAVVVVQVIIGAATGSGHSTKRKRSTPPADSNAAGTLLFIDEMRGQFPALKHAVGADLAFTGAAVCDAFDNGASYQAIHQQELASGFNASDAEFIISAAVRDLCPKYLGKLPRPDVTGWTTIPTSGESIATMSSSPRRAGSYSPAPSAAD